MVARSRGQSRETSSPNPIRTKNKSPSARSKPAAQPGKIPITTRWWTKINRLQRALPTGKIQSEPHTGAGCATPVATRTT